ncbi:MAG TPA: hypothetical protein VEB65_07090 [Solirubrobacterales bacterium]|nr:hypothetical protein [Solirubrobacterales bacterium]
MEHCPRCRLRDKVDAPLAFKAFDLSKIKMTGLNVADQVERSESGTSTNTSTATPSSVT